MVKAAVKTRRLNTRKNVKKHLRKDWRLYLLLLPGLLWFLAFAYKPMAGLRMAFYDYNLFQGYEGSTFVGFQNFREFITGADFLRVVKNTLMIAFWQL